MIYQQAEFHCLFSNFHDVCFGRKDLPHPPFMLFEMLIRSFPPQCPSIADETMNDAAKGAKCITPRGTLRIPIDLDHIPHISGICANNLAGALLPPFLILPHHSTAMHEFDEDIIDSHHPGNGADATITS
jgi:hypothetical protein